VPIAGLTGSRAGANQQHSLGDAGRPRSSYCFGFLRKINNLFQLKLRFIGAGLTSSKCNSRVRNQRRASPGLLPIEKMDSPDGLRRRVKKSPKYQNNEENRVRPPKTNSCEIIPGSCRQAVFNVGGLKLSYQVGILDALRPERGTAEVSADDRPPPLSGTAVGLETDILIFVLGEEAVELAPGAWFFRLACYRRYDNDHRFSSCLTMATATSCPGKVRFELAIRNRAKPTS